jgi:hypothetical protein
LRGRGTDGGNKPSACLELIPAFQINQVFIAEPAKKRSRISFKDKTCQGSLKAILEFIGKLGVHHPVMIRHIIGVFKIKDKVAAQVIFG